MNDSLPSDDKQANPGGLDRSVLREFNEYFQTDLKTFRELELAPALALTLAGHAMFLIALYFIHGELTVLSLFLGILQAVYVIPMLLIAAPLRPALARGIALCAVLTFMLNLLFFFLLMFLRFCGVGFGFGFT